jgi:hypothetical protein
MKRLFSIFPEHDFVWHYCEPVMECSATCFVAGGKIAAPKRSNSSWKKGNRLSPKRCEVADEGFAGEEVNYFASIWRKVTLSATCVAAGGQRRSTSLII